MEFLEHALLYFVNLSILMFEYIGVGVIVFTGIRGLLNWASRRPETKLLLAKGLALGLEFKVGSEILRTVVVRDASEFLIISGIIFLRAILTFLIHWEIKTEEKIPD